MAIKPLSAVALNPIKVTLIIAQGREEEGVGN